MHIIHWLVCTKYVMTQLQQYIFLHELLPYHRDAKKNDSKQLLSCTDMVCSKNST